MNATDLDEALYRTPKKGWKNSLPAEKCYSLEKRSTATYDLLPSSLS